MTSRQIVLCHPVRTAIGAYAGSLKDVAATELGAVAVRETLRRAGLDAGRMLRIRQVSPWARWWTGQGQPR